MHGAGKRTDTGKTLIFYYIKKTPVRLTPAGVNHHNLQKLIRGSIR